MNDLFNYYISEKIFLYYAAAIGPYDFERIAKMWNGSGASTIPIGNKSRNSFDNSPSKSELTENIRTHRSKINLRHLRTFSSALFPEYFVALYY